jgi:hypothetical protein
VRSLDPVPGRFGGPNIEAADQSRTNGQHLSPDPGVTAARRARLVADGGGLENR